MSATEPGAVIAGKYRLVEPISEGGMGAVWRAQHLELDAPVAIKFMRAELLAQEGLRVRFSREAKAAAQLRSPYVVHIYDHGFDEASGAPFIVMEMLEGEDLSRRLKREKCISPDKIIQICTQLCKGLSRAHDAGIVHRDLKPANVFLSKPDDDMAKLLDFGIAKDTGTQPVVGGDITTVGTVLGSPQYMSPEQAKGLTLDQRSDLWSLAVIMYRALTGRLPFLGDDINVLVRICTETPPPPSSLNAQLSERVDQFFERALDRDPDRRFGSAERFAKELEAALTSVPQASGDKALLDLPAPRAATSALPSQTTYVRKPLAVSAPSNTPWTRWVALGAGLVLAGGIILWVSSKPGDLPLGDAVSAVGDAVGKLRDAVGEGGGRGQPDAGVVSEQDAHAARVRDAWALLYRQVKLNEIPEAVASLETLVELDPDAATQKRNTVLDVAERAIARGDPTKKRITELLTTGMGSHGPDLLFDLIVLREKSEAAKEARGLLADARVRGRGSRDMQLAYAIHLAPACAKKAHVLRAEREGGERTLREIRGLTSCTASARCCLRDDRAVAKVDAAIVGRAGEAADAAAPPP